MSTLLQKYSRRLVIHAIFIVVVFGAGVVSVIGDVVWYGVLSQLLCDPKPINFFVPSYITYFAKWFQIMSLYKMVQKI